MTLIILAVMLVSLILISTEHFTNINKAAIAIFAGTVGWVLYICYGTDFIMGQHAADYGSYLSGMKATSVTAKHFIAGEIFLPYVGKASEIVLFLLATMTIVEILSNNGCFDFLCQLLKTRNSQRMLWSLAAITFFISANLDNLTTTLMMLIMMHGIIQSRRQRMIFGSAIVVSANCGGALTVIGDPAGLVLWNMGAVSATNFSMLMLLPCLVAWGITIWLIGRMLPERCDTDWIVMPYRGDDTRLTVWQRLLMLFVGIGGLWFIPTFHNITKLSPFLGALCVLSVLWVVNELVNRHLMNPDQINHRKPQILKYSVIQMILYVMGILLAMGVVTETGLFVQLSEWCSRHVGDVWLMGVLAGLMSSIVESFASCMSFISLYPLTDAATGVSPAFMYDGEYWRIVAYCTAMGGNILAVGSICGLAMIKMERIHIGWYFRHVGWKALVGTIVGLLVMFLMTAYFG
ncbi:MAG: sodium:proton antiporter [Prevotella sp.]|nr:sodium:proton antiporter [Prevotella sp.]